MTNLNQRCPEREGQDLTLIDTQRRKAQVAFDSDIHTLRNVDGVIVKRIVEILLKGVDHHLK
ncbi:hypothetical protein D3C87_2041020 [compost metagenome]